VKSSREKKQERQRPFQTHTCPLSTSSRSSNTTLPFTTHGSCRKTDIRAFGVLPLIQLKRQKRLSCPIGRYQLILPGTILLSRDLTALGSILWVGGLTSSSLLMVRNSEEARHVDKVMDIFSMSRMHCRIQPHNLSMVG
jgi:hypothetical protein